MKVFDLIGDVVSESEAGWLAFWGDPCISYNAVKDMLNSTDDQDITFRLSSDGGDLNTGEEIMNLMLSSGKNITIEIIGRCHSAATVLSLGASKIKAYKTSRCIFHNASFGHVAGNSGELREAAEYLDSRTQQIKDLYFERRPKMKENEVDFNNYFENELEVVGNQIVDLGFADELITTEPLNIEKFTVINKKSSMKNFPNFMKVVNDLSEKIDNLFPKPKNASATTESGETIYFDAEELSTGVSVYTDEEMTTSIGDGDIVVGGVTYTIKDGKVVDPEETTVDPPAESDPPVAANPMDHPDVKKALAQMKADHQKELKAVTDQVSGIRDALNDFNQALSDETPGGRPTTVPANLMEKPVNEMTPKERALYRLRMKGK